MNSVLDSSNPHRLMSLASRIKAIHRALTAEELAELLQVARLTIRRRAKRGSIPSFPRGFLCPIRFGCNRQVAYAAGRAVDVKSDAAVPSKDSEEGGTMKRRFILPKGFARFLQTGGHASRTQRQHDVEETMKRYSIFFLRDLSKSSW
jgi:hypothetical protein